MLYLAPSVLVAAMFFVLPLFFVSYISFNRWNGLGPPTYVGPANFSSLLREDAFRQSLINTIYWVLAGLFVHIPLALLVAIVLARRPFGWQLYRSIFVFPNVISTTAVSFLWYFVLHVELGLLNSVLRAAGLDSWTRPWLFDPSTALISTQLPFVLYIGFTMVIFLTQISTISHEYYEAAQIDGASAWQQDLHITLPLVRSAVAINALLVTAYCLRMFEYPFVMTGGGPANATMNLSLYIYRKMITANQYGLSMAAGMVTLAVGALAMSIVFLISRWSDRRW